MSSGLPDFIADSEDLARFLTQSSHFNATQVKPVAFLPNPREQETSVSRHGREPGDRLINLGAIAAGDRSLYGAALFKATNVRSVSLNVLSDEPPDFHAVIRNWPLDNDPVLQKAQQKERALQLASVAELLLF